MLKLVPLLLAASCAQTTYDVRPEASQAVRRYVSFDEEHTDGHTYNDEGRHLTLCYFGTWEIIEWTVDGASPVDLFPTSPVPVGAEWRLPDGALWRELELVIEDEGMVRAVLADRPNEAVGRLVLVEDGQARIQWSLEGVLQAKGVYDELKKERDDLEGWAGGDYLIEFTGGGYAVVDLDSRRLVEGWLFFEFDLEWTVRWFGLEPAEWWTSDNELDGLLEWKLSSNQPPE